MMAMLGEASPCRLYWVTDSARHLHDSAVAGRDAFFRITFVGCS